MNNAALLGGRGVLDETAADFERAVRVSSLGYFLTRAKNFDYTPAVLANGISTSACSAASSATSKLSGTGSSPVCEILSTVNVTHALFTGAERQTKQDLFGCRMCGQCALPVTGYVCPMGCPKELRNGPWCGVGADGSCEVYPALRCVWVEAYERAASQGRAADLRLLHRPIDHRRWGESSWLNYWQGRDEGLWVAAVADTSHEGPSSNSTHHRRRVLGGS